MDEVKKWRQGYKVVQTQGNRYISLCFTRWAGIVGSLRKFKVYAVGKKTRRTRGDGPLAVCPGRQEAVDLAENTSFVDGDIKVFKCRYLESTASGLWEYYQGTKRERCHVSPTTIFADEVELIEEVAGVGILYCVPYASQKAEVREYCLGSCGKALVAGVSIDGVAVIPCKSAECEHVIDTLDLGEYIFPSEGAMDVVFRKLAEVT